MINYDDDEHAAAAFSGAATSPSQQAPGREGGEGLWSAWPKADPQSPVDMPTPGCLRASCLLNCITRRISRTLPFVAGQACMELTRGSARDPDPLIFPCRLVALSRCSAVCSTAMSTWTTTTIPVRTARVWCGVVWGGMVQVACSHLHACPSRAPPRPGWAATHFRHAQRLELPEKLLVVGVYMHACMCARLHTHLGTYIHTAGRDRARCVVGSERAHPLTKSTKLSGLG